MLVILLICWFIPVVIGLICKLDDNWNNFADWPLHTRRLILWPVYLTYSIFSLGII